MSRSFYSQLVGTLILSGATIAPVIVFALIVDALQRAWV